MQALIIQSEGKSFELLYFDYIDAFLQTLFVQNIKETHTWLLRLRPSILNSPIPTWFLNWFTKVQPIPEQFPADLNKLFAQFLSLQPNQTHCLSLLTFMARYDIPWVFGWCYEIGLNSHDLPEIRRQFSVGWWKKFETTDLCKLIKKDLTELKDNFEDQLHQTAQKDISKLLKGALTAYSKESKEDIKKYMLQQIEQQIDQELHSSDAQPQLSTPIKQTPEKPSTVPIKKKKEKGKEKINVEKEIEKMNLPQDLQENSDMETNLGFFEKLKAQEKYMHQWFKQMQEETASRLSQTSSKGKKVVDISSSEEKSSTAEEDSETDYEAEMKALKKKIKSKKKKATSTKSKKKK